MEKKKILIVDDEAGFTRVVKLALEETGNYEVRVENKGQNALKTALEFGPDLILLDVIMPDISGGEVCSQIQSAAAVKNTPIVFLTAIVKEKELGPGVGVISGYPFLAKPVSRNKLIGAIERYTRK
jgi:CheY-like chemotaxis protein